MSSGNERTTSVQAKQEAFHPLSAEQAALFESSPYPTLVLDQHFRIRFVNAAALVFGNVDRHALIGCNVWDQYPELEGSIFHQSYASVLADGTPRHFEEHRAATDTWVSVYAYPAENGVVAVLQDITSRQRAEQLDAEFHQSQKLEALGTLAGGIAHDFNNLLVGILGNASLALLDLTADSPARRGVEEIEQAGQRAAELTRQLLAYAGKGRFVVESVDASAIISEMAALLRTGVSKQASMQLDLPTLLPAVDVDTTQFRQVVMNLVTNASDALAGDAGLISIRTGRLQLNLESLTSCVGSSTATPGDFVFVEVRDTGVGMDALTVARIFDPFFSTKFTGRGLGLAATLGIMRGHRGAIRVLSEVGAGTCMTLHFPVSDQRPRETLTPPDMHWRGTGRVLVVDDEASVRTVTRAFLQRRGFDVTDVADGLAALEAFRTDPDNYALVLLDLTMPGLGGEETFRALRELRPDLRVVLMSGYNEHEVTRLFVGRGLAGFLQKPFRADELYATVARILDIDRRAP